MHIKQQNKTQILSKNEDNYQKEEEVPRAKHPLIRKFLNTISFAVPLAKMQYLLTCNRGHIPLQAKKEGQELDASLKA